MPIFYEIYPESNFLLYILAGLCTADEYFNSYHSIYQKDERRHHGMKILMDAFNGDLDFEVKNLYQAIALIQENFQKGHPRDQVAFLTKNSGMINIKNTLFALGGSLPMELEIFHNLRDAMIWLGIPEMEEAVLTFRDQSANS